MKYIRNDRERRDVFEDYLCNVDACKEVLSRYTITKIVVYILGCKFIYLSLTGDITDIESKTAISIPNLL